MPGVSVITAAGTTFDAPVYENLEAAILAIRQQVKAAEFHGRFSIRGDPQIFIYNRTPVKGVSRETIDAGSMSFQVLEGKK